VCILFKFANALSSILVTEEGNVIDTVDALNALAPISTTPVRSEAEYVVAPEMLVSTPGDENVFTFGDVVVVVVVGAAVVVVVVGAAVVVVVVGAAVVVVGAAVVVVVVGAAVVVVVVVVVVGLGSVFTVKELRIDVLSIVTVKV